LQKNEGLGTLATNVRRVFRTFLTLFVTARIVWLTLHTFYASQDLATFILNRFSLVFFFTSFTLILLYWAESFHKNYYETKAFLPRLGWIFFISNFVLYVYQFVIIILFAFGSEDREGNPVYEANIVSDIALSAVISVGFFIYGILLFTRVKNMEDDTSPDRKRELMKILFITIIFTACFLVKCVFVLYRPITSHLLPEIPFYIFNYFLPELIPSLLQIYVSETTKEQQARDTKYIDDLYAESQDSVDDFRKLAISEETGLLPQENLK